MRPKKVILFIVVPLALIVALVALAPTLLSGYARGRVERELAARMQGTVALDALSLGWFSAQRIDGLVIDGGAEVGKVDASAEITEGLLALLRGSDITVTLRGSAATTFDSAGRIGLARLAKPVPDATPAAGSSPGAPGGNPLGTRALRVKLEGCALAARGPDGAAYALEKLEGSVGLVGAQLEVALDGIASTTDRAASRREGSLSVDLVSSLVFDTAGAIDRARTTGSVKIDATRLAWPTAAGELAFGSLRAEVAKDAQGTVKLAVDAVARLGESGESTVKADVELAEAISPEGGFALDPAKLRATVDARAVPMGALQPFAPELAPGVRLDLVRDIGESVDLAVAKQLGERARVALESRQLSLSFDGAVAADGSSIDGGTLEIRASMRSELLVALGLADPGELAVAVRGERLAWRRAEDVARALGGSFVLELARPFECAASFDPARVRVDTLSVAVEKGLSDAMARATVGAKGRLGKTGDTTLSARGELDIASRALVSGAVDSTMRLDSEMLERLTGGAVTARGKDASLHLVVPELAYIPSDAYQGIDALVARVRAELSGAISIAGAGTAAAVNDLAVDCSTPRGTTPGSLSLGAKVDGAALRVEQRFERLPKGGFDLARIAPSGTVVVAGLDPSFIARVAPAAQPWTGLLGRGRMTLDLRNGIDRGALTADFDLKAGATSASGALRVGDGAVSATNLLVDGVLTEEALASLALPEDTEVLPGARLSLRAPSMAFVRTGDAWRPQGDVVARVVVESLRARRAFGVAEPPGIARLDANASYSAAEERATLVGAASLEERAGVSAGDLEFSLRWRNPAEAKLFRGVEGSLTLSRLDLAKYERLLGVGPGRISGFLGGAGGARIEFTEVAAPQASVRLDFPSLDAEFALESSESASGRSVGVRGRLACELAKEQLDRLAGLDGRQNGRFLSPATVTLSISSASVPLDASMKPVLDAAAVSADGAISALEFESRAPDGRKSTLSMGAVKVTVGCARLGDEVALSARSEGAASATGTLVLDAKMRGALGAAPTLDASLEAKGVPSATVDILAATGGTVGHSLGSPIDVSLDAKAISWGAGSVQGSLSARLATPLASCTVLPLRFADGFVRPAEGATLPIKSEFEVTAVVREQVLPKLNPLFSDIVPGGRAKIEFESFSWPLDGDLRKFDAVLTVTIGETRLSSSGLLSGLLTAAGAGTTDDFRADFPPLVVTVSKGRATYKGYRCFIGRTAQGAWKNSLALDGDIDLAARPARVNALATSLPLADLRNWSTDARDIFARIDAVSPEIARSLVVGLEWHGPLYDAAGKPVKLSVRPKYPDIDDALKSLGRNPDAILDAVGDIFNRVRKPKPQ